MNVLQFGLGAVATVAVTGLASADVIMDQIGTMDGANTAEIGRASCRERV